MGKLKVISKTFNSLTGISGRHNRALRDITGFLTEIQGFISNYNLPEEGPNFKSLLGKIGYAKFDLTNLSYHLRPMAKTAKVIKGVKASPIIEEISNELEDFRRALMNPALRKSQLKITIAELLESVNNLQAKLSETEYR